MTETKRDTDVTYRSNGTNLHVTFIGTKYSGIVLCEYDSEMSRYALTATGGLSGSDAEVFVYSGIVSYEDHHAVCTDLSELLDGNNIVKSIEDIFFHLTTEALKNA